MNAKSINWGKAWAICGVAAFVFTVIGWSFHEASTYAALPGQVTDHERRISALEAENATNAVRLDDRLRDIDRELGRIFQKLQGSSAVSDMGAMNAMSATGDLSSTNVVSER